MGYNFKQQIIKQLKRDWPYLAGIALVFLFGIWLGKRLPKINPIFADQFGNIVKERFAEIARKFHNAPFFVEIWVIWLNNLQASLTAVMVGMILGPVFPPFFVILNGMIIGFFKDLIQVNHGLTTGQFFLSLLPHGIFELPAFFIATWVGIKFGVVSYSFIWRYLGGKEPKFFKGWITCISDYFENEARHYVILITGMLLVAAVLEVMVSPFVIRK